MSACLSNVEIERYTLGTLGDRETRRIREHLSDYERFRAAFEPAASRTRRSSAARWSCMLRSVTVRTGGATRHARTAA